MSDRIIYCCICDTKVGIVRDAKLMVGLKYMCAACHSDEYSTYSKFETNNKPNNDMNDWGKTFSDMFGYSKK